MTDLSLYVITADASDLGRTHEDVARAALTGGANIIQFRDKAKSGDELKRAAEPVRRLCALHGVPFVMNDDAHVAAALEADGLHVGQEDLGELSAWMQRPRSFYGISITERGQVALAEELRPLYLGVGPVFSTPSKDDAAVPRGLDGLAEVRALTDLPVVVIGGITLENAKDVMATGVDGVCVISAVARAEYPEDAVARLREIVDRAMEAGGR